MFRGGRAPCPGCVKAKPLLWRLACHLTYFASKPNPRQCKTKDLPHGTVQSGGSVALGSVIRHRKLVGSDVEFIAEVAWRQTVRFLVMKSSKTERRAVAWGLRDSEKLVFRSGVVAVFSAARRAGNRERAREIGVDARTIAGSVRTFFGSAEVTEWIDRDRQYPVILQAPDAARTDTSDLLGLQVRTAAGGLVPLDGLVEVERRASVRAYERLDRQPTVEVSAALAEGTDIGTGPYTRELQSGAWDRARASRWRRACRRCRITRCIPAAGSTSGNGRWSARAS